MREKERLYIYIIAATNHILIVKLAPIYTHTYAKGIKLKPLDMRALA